MWRFKQLFAHCKATNYKDIVPFEIGWKTYLLQKKGIPANFQRDMSVFIFDDGTTETQFLEKLIKDFMDYL